MKRLALFAAVLAVTAACSTESKPAMKDTTAPAAAAMDTTKKDTTVKKDTGMTGMDMKKTDAKAPAAGTKKQ